MRMILVCLFLSVVYSSVRSEDESTPWPKEFFKPQPLQFYDCLYNFYYCIHYYGTWPDNKDECYNIYKVCDESIKIPMVKGTIKNMKYTSESTPLVTSTLPSSTTLSSSSSLPISTPTSATSSSIPQTPSSATTTTINDIQDSDGIVGVELNSGNAQDLPKPSFTTTASPLTGPESCDQVLKEDPNAKTGIHILVLDGVPKKVWCKMENGVGWTVLQQRGDYGRSKDYFLRNWTDYRNGFGVLGEDYWIGLESIFELTNQPQKVDLTFVLEDFEGNITKVTLVEFRVANEENGYRLFYKGIVNHNRSQYPELGRSVPAKGTKFSTVDRDNDVWKKNCALRFSGSWWYSACHNSNINGLYHRGEHESFGDGVNWFHFRGYHYSLKSTIMLIRPTVPRQTTTTTTTTTTETIESV